jgi:hypothetical protein
VGKGLAKLVGRVVLMVQVGLAMDPRALTLWTLTATAGKALTTTPVQMEPLQGKKGRERTLQQLQHQMQLQVLVQVPSPRGRRGEGRQMQGPSLLLVLLNLAAVVVKVVMDQRRLMAMHLHLLDLCLHHWVVSVGAWMGMRAASSDPCPVTHLAKHGVSMTYCSAVCLQQGCELLAHHVRQGCQPASASSPKPSCAGQEVPPWAAAFLLLFFPPGVPLALLLAAEVVSGETLVKRDPRSGWVMVADAASAGSEAAVQGRERLNGKVFGVQQVRHRGTCSRAGKHAILGQYSHQVCAFWLSLMNGTEGNNHA